MSFQIYGHPVYVVFYIYIFDTTPIISLFKHNLDMRTNNQIQEVIGRQSIKLYNIHAKFRNATVFIFS